MAQNRSDGLAWTRWMAIVVLGACAAMGCQPNHGPQGKQTLACGGIFWPCLTPGFAAETGGDPILAIPAGSPCDVRMHPGTTPGRARVKVRVGGSWHLVWVDKVVSRDIDDMRYLPFETLAYMTCGSDQEPDRDWLHTEVALLAAARHQRAALSERELRVAYGDRTYEAHVVGARLARPGSAPQTP